MPSPGDVVIADFPGATGIKRRPAVVVSSDLYHAERPDLILAVLTSNVSTATAQTDYIIQDWTQAGLRAASAFRCYFAMTLPGHVHPIGRLSDRDWQAVHERILRAFG